MHGRHAAIVAAIGLVTSVPAYTGDLSSPAYTPRQMAHCMMKRLRADAAKSYRDAFKACKSEFDSVRSDRPADTDMTAATLPENPQKNL